MEYMHICIPTIDFGKFQTCTLVTELLKKHTQLPLQPLLLLFKLLH